MQKRVTMFKSKKLFLHLMDFGFLATVTSSMLSWGHLTFSNIIDLAALTLLD